MRGMQKDPSKLKLSFDRKVSNTGWWYGKRNFWVATTPNSFGLPAGDSCPGRTSFCDQCYGVNTEIHMPQVRTVLEHNLRLLQEAGGSWAMHELLREMVGRYWRYVERKGMPMDQRIFRIHWDGDFFNKDYAHAWRATIQAFPHIKFWTYTRSFFVVSVLHDLPNLKLYLSIDRDNAQQAGYVIVSYPTVLLAGCAEDYRRARELVGERQHLICPENSGRLGLNDGGVGACVKCMLCPEGKRDVLFSTSHRENVDQQMVLIGVGRKCACGCGRIIPPTFVGRPRKWFEEKCRWKVYNERRAKGEVK